MTMIPPYCAHGKHVYEEECARCSKSVRVCQHESRPTPADACPDCGCPGSAAPRKRKPRRPRSWAEVSEKLRLEVMKELDSFAFIWLSCALEQRYREQPNMEHEFMERSHAFKLAIRALRAAAKVKP